MKWVIQTITRESAASLNVWLAQNTAWEPISVQDLQPDRGWLLVARTQIDETDLPPELN